MESLVRKLLQGDQRSLARLITLLERGDPSLPQVMALVHPHVGNAYSIGVTGPPGAGKSTLVDKLVSEMRRQKDRVGVLAVDPTSPFSGGAVLGDRVRMQRHYLDEYVFIRSLATRGHEGGLSRVTRGAIKLLDAAGTDTIMVETVGVGQTEVKIMGVVDTVIVVLVPESGDAIQTMKAGLLEVADIFVVNKADRQGAQKLASEIRTMLNMADNRPTWRPPILLTQAHKDQGIPELYDAIKRHKQNMEDCSLLQRKRQQRMREEFLETIDEVFHAGMQEMMADDTEFVSLLREVEEGKVDALEAALQVLGNGVFMRNWIEALQRHRL